MVIRDWGPVDSIRAGPAPIGVGSRGDLRPPRVLLGGGRNASWSGTCHKRREAPPRGEEGKC